MANRSLSVGQAELLRQELKALRDRNLQESTFEERADLVAKLGIKILPSQDLKSRKIFCRLNLAEVNEEREQAGFAKVTFGGAGGIRTPYLLTASQTFSQLNYSPIKTLSNLTKNGRKCKPRPARPAFGADLPAPNNQP
jgi:hypothetical protein